MLSLTTKRTLTAFLAATAISLGGGMAVAGPSACTETEKWCTHKLATFCENEGCSAVSEEGQCVPQEKSCDEFWCGNRQCASSWLISRNVCCIYYSAENSPNYSCAASELSCPGNTAQLTIRPTLASNDVPDLNN